MPTYSRHPTPGQWRGSSRGSKEHVPNVLATANITEAELDSLPLNIQRKFFSPVERLRIAEHTASLRPPQSQQRQPRSRSIRRTRSSHSLEHLHRSSSLTRRRLKKPQAARYEQLVSQQAEAQWYLSLPAKIRRQHFSREEQILLANRCDTLSQEPELPEEDYIPPPPPIPADYEPFVRRCTPPRPKTASSQGTTIVGYGPAIVQHAISVKYFRPDDMASCFDPSYGKRNRGQTTSRRTLSLSGASTRHSMSSIPPLLPSPIPPFSAGHKRNFSAAPRKSESSQSTFDPNAVHYKDPEARAKLRTYLGSPQKFDEAVEFGFPASQAAEPATAAEPSTTFLAPLTLSHDVQSFMNDDWLPFLDTDGEDDDEQDALEEPVHDDSSVPDAPSPVTPGDHEEIYHRAQRMALNAAVRSPTQASPQQAPHLKPQPSFFNDYSTGGFGMREMTLRLTLTRPDLRANEDELYGWQGKPRENPLALEELPVSDDIHGEKNPFGASTSRASKRESKSLKRYFTIKKDRKILGYSVG